MSPVEVRPWLPETAFDLDHGSRALEACLKAWSNEWFAGQARVSQVKMADGLAAPEKEVAVRKAGVMLTIAPGAKRALFEDLCVIDLAEVTPGEREHGLIDALTERALDDLAVQLTKEHKADPAEPLSVQLHISLGNKGVIQAHIARSLFVACVKRALSSPNPAARPLLSRRLRALGSLPVALHAVVGRGALSMTELRGLAVGDIVLLDQQEQDGVSLELAARRTAIARGQLGRDGDRPTLHL